MKIIKFNKNLVELILKGEKTSTWRLFDDKDLQVGDELILVNKDTGEEFAQAVIVKLQEKKLSKLEESDWEGHERYESLEVMYKAFSKFYPNHQINSDTLVKIVKFKINNFLV
jgi:hypothetical protein